MNDSAAASTPPRPHWTHRLLAACYRRPEHRGKYRLIGLLHRLTGLARVQASPAPGVVMELDPDDFLQREILLHGGYERDTLALFDRLLAQSSGMIDFGAHMGLYTLRAARALHGRGRVFAVEPTPTHAVALLHNAALSGLKNIELCSLAAGAEAAVLRMIAPHSANTGGSRLADRTDLPDLRSIPIHVAVRPAAELAPLIPPACFDLMKIDVEGHEFNILRSLLPAAPRKPRHILFEYKPAEFDYGPAAATVDWLAGQGYELLTVEGAAFRPDAALPDDNIWARLR